MSFLYRQRVADVENADHSVTSPGRRAVVGDESGKLTTSHVMGECEISRTAYAQSSRRLASKKVEESLAVSSFLRCTLAATLSSNFSTSPTFIADFSS